MTGKARRGAFQIIVGLLVDRHGFPLQAGCFRGQPGRDHHYHPRGGGLPGRWRHRRARSGRRAPACCRLLTWRYRMRRSRGSSPGARQVSALCWQGDVPADGWLIDTITSERGSKSERNVRKPHEPVEHPDSWTAVWAYSKKRAARNTQTLTT